MGVKAGPVHYAMQSSHIRSILRTLMHRKKWKYELQNCLNAFLIDSSYLEELSNNFLTIVMNIGTYIAGDEKLLRFFGESGSVRVVISRPDRVGLWFYQLAYILSKGLLPIRHRQVQLKNLDM